MKKNKKAISNNIYENKKIIRKVYINNDFKNYFSKEENEIINKYDSELKILDSKKNEIFLNKIKKRRIIYFSKKKLNLISKEMNKFWKIKLNNKKNTPFLETYKFLGGKDNIKKIEDILKRDVVLCHNDLVKNNILYGKNKIQLIDFEYSWYGNKIFDIASFLTEIKISKRKKEYFVSLFKINKNELKLVTNFLYKFWSLWAEYMYKQTSKNIFLKIWKDKKRKITNE